MTFGNAKPNVHTVIKSFSVHVILRVEGISANFVPVSAYSDMVTPV